MVARRGDGTAEARVRRSRHRGPAARPARADGQRRGGLVVAAARRRRRRRRRPRGRRRRAAECEDAGEARRARLRRAHGRAALDVPHDPREGRVRLRHVAHAGLGRVHRQRGRLGAAVRRSRARPRLLAGRRRDERHLRRRAARQQLVRQQPRRARREDRRARVAPAARASRHLGLRQPDVADPARRQRRRATCEGRRAAHEASVRVRVRSRDRRAALADRGATGADVRRAGRVDGADAAVPDEADRVRPPGRERGRSRRFHAGDQGRGARGREGPADGADVHAAVADRRARRYARRARAAALRRRRELGGRRGGSRDGHAVRRARRRASMCSP